MFFFFFQVFFCKPECDVPDEKFRDCIFEIIVNNTVLERFYTFYENWEMFPTKNLKLKKKLGYFDVEVFGNKNITKKKQSLKKSAKGMEFKSYAKRINSLKDIEKFAPIQQEKQWKNNSIVLGKLKNETLKFMQIKVQ